MLIPEKEILRLRDSIEELIREVAIDIEPTLPSFDLSEEDLTQAKNEASEKTKLKEIEMYARINKIQKELQNSIFRNTEEEYLTFVLGYDLFHQKLNNTECDISFYKCKDIIKDFLKSEEYKNMKVSAYEALQAYLERREI